MSSLESIILIYALLPVIIISAHIMIEFVGRQNRSMLIVHWILLGIFGLMGLLQYAVNAPNLHDLVGILWCLSVGPSLVGIGIAKTITRRMFRKNYHPECLSNEVFVTNSDEEGFYSIGWETKRRGRTAYDIYGNPISKMDWPGSFPVFVKKEELKRKAPELIKKMAYK